MISRSWRFTAGEAGGGRWCGGGGITFLIATLIVIDAPPAANQE